MKRYLTSSLFVIMTLLFTQAIADSSSDLKFFAGSLARTVKGCGIKTDRIACMWQANRGFFAKDLVIGEPSREGTDVNLPLKLPSSMLHSAQWLYDATYEVVDKEIHIRAYIVKPPFMTPKAYKDKIILKNIKQGDYSLYFINKDGSKHLIGNVKIN